ncbi:MAG TPA: hypothetical protein PKE12_01085 [Kiritimatiellia bacterium]|nr:hypothetical protein [Kiritimatiellia bacterium]
MKNRWIILCSLLAALVATAAPPPPGPEFDAPPPGPPPPHVQHFFEVLQQRNPEEFERMRQLRETDPEAFRAELGERLRKARDRHGAAPAFRPPGAPDDDAGPKRRSWRNEDGEPMFVQSPELRELEARARDLVRQLRATEDGPKRKEHIESLRDTLTRSFELRQQLRRQRVEEMKMRLREVETVLDERERDRTAYIEKQLTTLLDKSAPPP